MIGMTHPNTEKNDKMETDFETWMIRRDACAPVGQAGLALDQGFRDAWSVGRMKQ
jgi:hypothetical protein